MRPSNAPDSAIPIPPPGNAVSDAQATQIAAIRTTIDDMNRVAGGIWDSAKSDWLSEAGHDRELGITIRKKPDQPMGSEVVIGADTNTQSGIIWVWLEALPIGTPCPDLPPVHVTVMGEAKIGLQIQDTPYFSVLAGDTTPNGKTVAGVSADGKEGLYTRLFGFGAGGTQGGGGWFLKVAMLLLCLSLLMPAVHAQVSAACSPQPMAGTKSIGEMAMGQWACWVSNDSGAPYILTPAKFYASVIQVRPVTPAVAQQIIADSINKLPQSKLVKVGQVALALGGVGATLYTGNAQWSLIGGLVSQNAPKMLQIVANEIPNAAPFTGGQLSAPVTILPGGDMPPVVVYAMRAKKETLAPFTVALK